MSKWLETIIHSKNKTFIVFCFCFITGAAIFSFATTASLLFTIVVSSVSLLGVLSMFWKNALVRFFIVGLLFFMSGGIRFLITIPSSSPEHIRYYNNQKITVVGIITKEPDIRIDKTYYTFKVTTIHSIAKVSGRILLKAPLYPMYNYGDSLRVVCKLQLPQKIETANFHYNKYLAEQGIFSTCSFPQITFLSSGHGNKFMTSILWFKNKVSEEIHRLWPEPESSLMAGLLYGNSSNLPEELKNNFNRTGASHIIAISGFNITIISVVLLTVLIYLGLWRQQAFWVVVILIIFFVIFTGASASVVRAGIMGILVLVARQLGRLSRIGTVLVATALVMVIVNPYVVVWDAGFQLSFLATVGLVYVSPLLEKFFLFTSLRTYNEMLLENLQSTLAALIMTLPLILFQFGRFSVVAPLVNVLILWIIPWLMLAGFCAVVIGSINFSWGILVLG
jgi:competence protein ComEC